MDTPQSVVVIGAEQIRDQKPNTLDKVLRDSAGVRAGTFGADGWRGGENARWLHS